ncbi:MAG: hypothetical protein ACYSTS_08330 [Planctomycetota bacterium]|jgi:hypothetical protein
MTTFKEANCHKRNCIHYVGMQDFREDGDELGAKSRHVCFAFPVGIPDIITYGDDKHLEPLKNQGNYIVYRLGESTVIKNGLK